MRVAIVGSGVGGLSAFYFLKKHSPHEVNIYERDGVVGGQARGVIYDRQGKEPLVVDTGLMAFSSTGSPMLSAFLKLLNLSTRPADMRLNVTRDGLLGPSSILNPRAWRLSFDIARWTHCADPEAGVSLGQYLTREGYSAQLFNDYLLPQIAQLYLVTDDLTALSLPANAVVNGLVSNSSWTAIQGGGLALVDTLAATIPPENLHLNAEIVSVTSHDYGVRLVEAGGAHHIYDHVILAVPSKRALKLIKAGGWASEEEQAVLGSVEWSGLDVSLGPGTLATAVRYESTPAPPAYDASLPNATQQLTLTYDMERIQSLPGITATLTSGTQFEVAYPSTSVTSELSSIQNTRRIAYAGAWTGLPRAEDALSSALQLVTAEPFNASPPLETPTGVQSASGSVSRRRGVLATLVRIVFACAERVRRAISPFWTVLTWPVALALAVLEAVTRPLPRVQQQVALVRRCWQ